MTVAPPAVRSSAPDPADADTNIYGVNFWLAYAANLLLVAANAMTFRFAEFVATLGQAQGHHGGTEGISGWIVSTGMVSALLMRLWLGQGIDRYGARAIWLMTGFLYLAGCLGFLIPAGLTAMLWLSRVAYQVGLAGMFSCSMVNIQNQVPPGRRTEVIGSLGSSGFLGTILGTQVADLLFKRLSPGDVLAWFGSPLYGTIFGSAAVLGALHMCVVMYLTREDVHIRPAETPHALRLLSRYWPGAVVWVAISHGVVFSVTTVYLTRYATELKLRGIGTFFLGYSVTAFVSRWLTRDWGVTIGRHRMVLRGLLSLFIGLSALLLVRSDSMFLLPGALCGFGVALLFPAILSLGAGQFPLMYRGTGTTLVLGFIDLGTILASPVLGMLIDSGNALGQRWAKAAGIGETPQAGLGFTLMFCLAAGIVATVFIYYMLIGARRPDVDPVLTSVLPEAVPQAASVALPADESHSGPPTTS